VADAVGGRSGCNIKGENVITCLVTRHGVGIGNWSHRDLTNHYRAIADSRTLQFTRTHINSPQVLLGNRSQKCSPLLTSLPADNSIAPNPWLEVFSRIIDWISCLIRVRYSASGWTPHPPKKNALSNSLLLWRHVFIAAGMCYRPFPRNGGLLCLHYPGLSAAISQHDDSAFCEMTCSWALISGMTNDQSHRAVAHLRTQSRQYFNVAHTGFMRLSLTRYRHASAKHSLQGIL
jgi:hypothetical protein